MPENSTSTILSTEEAHWLNDRQWEIHVNRHSFNSTLIDFFKGNVDLISQPQESLLSDTFDHFSFNLRDQKTNQFLLTNATADQLMHYIRDAFQKDQGESNMSNSTLSAKEIHALSLANFHIRRIDNNITHFGNVILEPNVNLANMAYEPETTVPSPDDYVFVLLNGINQPISQELNQSDLIIFIKNYLNNDKMGQHFMQQAIAAKE